MHTPPAGPPMDTTWRSSRVVPLLGGTLTALVAAAVLGVGWLDYRANVEARRQGVELMARVLEDHATRTVDTASLALISLADRVRARPNQDSAELEATLAQALAALPHMRGFAVLDRRGELLAAAGDRARPGQLIDLARLGPLPAAERELLGTFVAGRGLGDLVAGATARAVAPAGLGFVPLLRVVHADNREWLLVGLINPDAIANQQTMTLADQRSSALLADYRGHVLAGTASASALVGRTLAAHPVFGERLRHREHDSYVGEGLGPGARIVAFRASRTRPLVVVVDYPEAAVRGTWWLAVREVAAVFGAALLLLIGMTVVAWRGLRARERTRAALDLAQQEVAHRERELSITVKSVQEVIFRTDAQGALTFVNDRWPLIGGRSAAEAVGTRLTEAVGGEQRAAVQALFAVDPGIGVRTAQLSVHPSPQLPARLLDVAVVPLVEGGRITGFAGSAIDVTERVSAQQKLQTQLALTELMLETSPLPLSLRDTQGRFLSVNQAWEEFTGLRRDQVLGRAVPIPVCEQEHELHSAYDRELLALGERVRYEASLLHRDGSRRDAVIQKALVPGASGPAGILTVVTDVSEFRAAERATREARDAAEEASRAKSEFIANISHELRTPLQSILGFSELGVVRGRAEPKLAGMFSEIHESGRRMLALVNDLLDVAKIESPVGTLHLERTDLRPLVRAVGRELEPLLADKRLHLAMEIDEQALVAKVDPLRFQQVVRNVLANAIRFSPPGARIDLACSATAEGEAHLRIDDQGPGVPPGELEAIFDAFIQSSKTKDGSGGTGLGLTISRKILRVFGGRIRAENRPEGGASFHVHVPLRTSPDTAPAPL